MTIGKDSFSPDPRYSVAFRKPENWRLKIRPIMAKDNGTYLCQVSTHPPILFLQHLRVIGKNYLLLHIIFYYQLHYDIRIFMWTVNHLITSASGVSSGRRSQRDKRKALQTWINNRSSLYRNQLSTRFQEDFVEAWW